MTASPSPTPNEVPQHGVIVHVFGRTDVGRTREHNEDSFIVADLTAGNETLHPEVRTHVVGERGTLFMVADGMGGAAAGEIASDMAVKVVLEEVKQRWCTAAPPDAEKFAAAIKGATEMANTKIHRFAAEHPEHRGMGTTATIAGFLGDKLYVAQVGDSRAYLIRNTSIKQITKDQSLMQKLIEAKELTEDEAERSDRRNIILQALGPEATVKVDLTTQPVRRGDTLILCSDGLSGQVRKEDMARVAGEEQDLMILCKRLIDMANESGGPDNITVIVARFEGDGLEPPIDGDEVGHQVYRLDESETPTAPVDRFVRRSHAKTVPIAQPTLPVDVTARTEPSGAPIPRSARTSSPKAEAPRAAAAPTTESRREQGRVYLIALAVLGVLIAAALAWRQFAGN